MAIPEIRTLIADDHPDIRALVRTVLTGTPDFVVCGLARNGAEAVQLALADQPDLVLLDVLMPMMDGVVALPLIREAAPAAKVVYITVLDRWLVEGVEPTPPEPDAFLSKVKLVTRPGIALDELREVMGR